LLAAIERLLAGPGREERRRWPRKRLTIDVPVEVDDVPARVIDIGYGGAQVEVFRPGADRIPSQLRLLFPVSEVALDADLVWGSPERAGRWVCGVAVRPGHEQAWRGFVDSL
jgi:hypothetical protein